MGDERASTGLPAALHGPIQPGRYLRPNHPCGGTFRCTFRNQNRNQEPKKRLRPPQRPFRKSFRDNDF